MQSLKAVVPNAYRRTGKRHALFDILHNNHTSQTLLKTVDVGSHMLVELSKTI
ncbi:hypothetical protein [Prevotella sp. oral taxon 317]|uniref:hypothetical protein n=1 Tax=Prevotella sp. oral taxon 317 TaxID=652721 RepID=UPI00030883A0|nr:hypothetical protein [Prevotella sp. oral taxon 317]